MIDCLRKLNKTFGNVFNDDKKILEGLNFRRIFSSSYDFLHYLFVQVNVKL